MMMESSGGVNLHNQFQKLLQHVEVLNEGIEPQFIQLAMNFEECRKKWLQADVELGSCKEVLSKAETERGSLEVKLKHARNQVDVEIRRRQKAEAEYEKLERQLQLIKDLLISESSSSSVHLSEEQRSALAFLSAHSQVAKANLNNSRRLTCINESASMLSDISYDQTDDSVDWDASVMKNVRLRKRQKRRSSRKLCDAPPQAVKKPRSTGRAAERTNESLGTKTTITVVANGGPAETMVSTIETVPYYLRTRRTGPGPAWADTTTTDQSETASEAPSTPSTNVPHPPRTPRANGGGKKHQLIPKTVIKSEFCVPCGRRTKFGKMYLRCQDCRMVTHPECRDRCPLPCNPSAFGTPMRTTEAAATLADFAPPTAPMIPILVIQCIREIERRGMREVGLYRLSGTDRLVKELKEKFMRGKTLPSLNKIDDINVITGVLKDFLRNLPEPLLTCRLNKAFMEAAEIQDEGNSLAMFYQTVSELPYPNRDTLACLMIHLQKVSQFTENKMDVNNLARVFGPTLVGHAVPDPDPMTILHDTSRQPRVIERLLSIPAEYWSQFAHPDNMNMNNGEDMHTPDPHQVSILGPVTTPEHHAMTKTPSSSSLSQRMKQTLSSTTLFGSRSKVSTSSSRQGSTRQNGFFASPQLK